MSFDDDFIPPAQFDEYQLIRQIGRGGMGQVYLCHDTKLDRRVAVKFIRHLDAGSEAQRRFEIEARAIARLEAHTNVVTVYRLGEYCGCPYLVSQYISGQSLDNVPKPLPWKEVLRIGIGVARGLAAAHAQRILHRDIKPANIMLTEEGQVKLLDFGLAKLLDSGSGGSDDPVAPPPPPVQGEVPTAPPSALAATLDQPGRVSPPAAPKGRELTETGNLMGTPLYMSPEAWRGERATARSDIYSLGAVLYELAAGVPPHDVDSLLTLRDAVQHQAVSPLGRTVKEISPQLASAIERCLRIDPEARYASVAELLAELEEISSQTTRPATPVSQRPRQLRLAAASGGLLLAGLALWTGLKLWSRPAEMIFIPGGTFWMGSTAKEIESAAEWCGLEDKSGSCKKEPYEREQPLREVAVSSFRIDRTEVTQADYITWLNRQKDVHLEEGNWVMAGAVVLLDIYPTFNPSHGMVYDGVSRRYRVLSGYERQPVVQVTWDGAQRYCVSHGKRLATEAEWEYAARGPQLRRFPWGNEEPRCDGVVFSRFTGLACATPNPGPKDVGSASQDRTPEGVLDMGGNLGEWVADAFVDRYGPCRSGCKDPYVSAPGPTAADGRSAAMLRVVRGGSWLAGASVTRAASRSRWKQNQGMTNIGFRCVASRAN